MHAALFLIAPEAAARNVRVESQIDADARLFADPVQVQQVLANLLMNGIQAIESGSSHERTLTVSAKLSGAEVMFDVCDTGRASNSNRSISFSSRFSRANPTAWEWASRSHARSSTPTTGASGHAANRAPAAASFALPAHPRTTGPAA